MSFEQGLRLATKLFEVKIVKLKEDYKSKNPNCQKKDVDSYVNRRLKKDIDFLIKANISGATRILN